MSCVLRVSAAGRSALLTGDIEREQEAALLASPPGPGGLRSEVLVVPHHGSKTSSSAAFLDAVQPAVAVFQAGYRNRYGHPAPEVLARYWERGIAIVSTPDCGAWRWAVPSAGPSPPTPAAGCQRANARRYWHSATRVP